LAWGIFVALLLATATASASGPKYVAGVSYFNSSVMGRPLLWPDGVVNYYVDQGPLNGTVSNQQATSMVDAAAALWSDVPTAGVTLTDKGQLAEDVNGSTIAVTNGVITAPADLVPTATGFPVGVVYDADGTVIDAVFGVGASQPINCQDNGVWFWTDNYTTSATFAHAVIVLNGLCATTPDQLEMMSFQLERAFGRVLGLDYSQVNPGALSDGDTNGALGTPVMQPISGDCGTTGGECIPNPHVLRWDDIAALNRLYPITAANLASFTGKQLTAASTVSIQGTVSFRTGAGMQGVNVVARPLDASGNPMEQYTVTAVSGVYFNGNHGNAITGFTDSNNNRLDMWGSSDATLQGFFDLSDIPLPPGLNAVSYQVTFEAINPVYILENSVGPYLDAQPTPSGTLAMVSVPSLSAGSTQTLTINVEDSAIGDNSDAIGTRTEPRPLPASGQWLGRLSQIGQMDWFTFPVRGNRTFTIVTEALDAIGKPTEQKAMPAIGVWDAFDASGTAPIGSAPGMNGSGIGESWLRVNSSADDQVMIGVTDQRGDGRPDYPYQGWVLYADTVSPLRLLASGGPIVIHGMGFRLTDTVLVGGQAATVTSISPNEITAIAPPAATGVVGSVDVEVDDLPALYAAAIVTGGVSYNSGSGDALTLVTAPMNTVPINVPEPFSVIALGADLTPAGNVTVLYTVTSGTAKLACGLPACAVQATGDGRASMNVTAVDSTWSIVTASLTNGSSLQAQFAGGTPPSLASLTPQLSLAAGSTITWTVEALVQSNGMPISGQSVAWQSSTAGIEAQGNASALSNSSGIASQTLTVGPLAQGQTASINACLNGTSQCVTFTAFGSRPEYAYLEAVSGTTQSLSIASTPSQITLRVLDMDGNPMAGGIVTLYEALYTWTPPCPPHGRCDQGQFLSAQASTATSALDGTVTFTPASIPGSPTNLVALAATGDTSSLAIAVEQHP
jgi:hypothetical protein